MKKCIIITNEFPYFSGEPFLLNELPYLSGGFEQIYIFSINANKNDKITRNYPSNVKVFPVGAIHSRLRYLIFILKGLLVRNKDLKIKFNLGIKKILSEIYIRGRAEDTYSKIKRLINREGLYLDDTVVYSFWFSYQAIAAWRLRDYLIKKGNKATAFSRAHGYDLYWERSAVNYLPYQDISLSKLKKVFSCSEMGRKYLLEKFPKQKSKVAVSKLGTLDHGIYNCSSIPNLLVTCCNLESLKRMPLFAEAFSILCKENSNLQWVCIGSGEEESIIRQIVNAHCIEERVEFLGRIPNSEVIDFYKRNDVAYFCNVSTIEGIPVSIMEALSFGIPVIATNVGGTSELVSDENGFLIDAQLTPIKLYEILKKAVEISADEYQGKRIAARKKWEIESSAEKNYTDFLKLISE